MYWESIAWNLASVVVGGLITWRVARRYYVEAAKDLKDETQELQRLMHLILSGLESSGLVRYSRNEQGRITGVNFMFRVEGGRVAIDGQPAELRRN